MTTKFQKMHNDLLQELVLCDNDKDREYVTTFISAMEREQWTNMKSKII